MNFITEYVPFLAKLLSVLIAFVLLLWAWKKLQGSSGKTNRGRLEIHSLTQEYQAIKEQMEQTVLRKDELKSVRKQNKAQQEKQARDPRNKVFVLDFEGDIKASAVRDLRHSITALLGVASSSDEVVVRLESAGGMVHAYGLAASQLLRIREAGIPLTVCVDKVAASGGYMMACLANRLLAAPFAVLGSIGVVAQLPNLHRLLKKHDIDYELLTAGEYKRTLTIFGENTAKGREKFQEDLELTHQLFKDFVSTYRPQLLMNEVATGEIWLGTAALNKQLVDDLMTSDAYLLQRIQSSDVFHITYVEKKNLSQRLGILAASVLEQGLIRLWTRLNEHRFWH